ncbi:uncharacterized protein [Arachis hypogaea]|uniref:uncharacterized protein n=1 Tax=Arachis hypogaea TaxID=3818 RepID=UPI003B211917
MEANLKLRATEAYHVLRYLEGAPGQGILFSSNSKFNISVYTDVDWDNFIALLGFMNIEAVLAMLFCDNISAIHMAKIPALHERSKHVEIDCHFIKEKVEAGIVKTDILTKTLPAP